MKLSPYFLDRAFADLSMPASVRYRVDSLEWEAIGGPSLATLTATGEEMELWRLFEYLRYPVQIANENDDLGWWGIVSEVRVKAGVMEVGVTLDSMQNRVAVAYSYIEPGSNSTGQRKTTAWAQDDDSVTEYGTKEWLSSASGLTDTAALARRAAVLALNRFPGGMAQQLSGRPDSQDAATATMTCRGWMDTLGWRYGVVGSVVGPSYTVTSAAEQVVGSASTNSKVVQQFSTGPQAINILSVNIYGRKQGAPADNIVVGIYALDTNGNPTGSALASASVAGSGLSSTLSGYGAWGLTETELPANTLYGFQVSRSGAVDATNYYAVGVNTALGYAPGVFKIWNGSSWVARSPDADMYFKVNVNNKVETSTQVHDLATAYGQWITGVDIDAASGQFTGSYRDGDTTALAEILELLKLGGPNGRRYLAEVDRQRRLHVYEEPANTPLYQVNNKGVIVDMNSGPVIEFKPPVGSWVQLADVVPANVDLSRLADPTLQFIEGATWTADGGLQLRFRGQPSLDELMGMN